MLDITNKPLQLRFVAHDMIERFILPERLPCTTEHEIGTPRRGAFQPARDNGEELLGQQQQMHVVRHNDPGPKVVVISPSLAILKGFGHHSRDSRIAQPDRSEGGLVCFAVEGKEGLARRKRLAHSSGRKACMCRTRERAGQAPCNEEKGSFPNIRKPVREFSAAEHRRLAGESTCPSFSGHRKKKISGVTLIEMMVVVTIIGLMAGIAFPAVSAGLDSVRLRSGTDSIAAFLNAAVVRTERRQEAIELTISAKDGTLALYSNEPGFTRELKMPDGITIEAAPERLILLPGAAVPGIGIQVANRHGSRRVVHLDPMTGFPRVESAETK